MKPAAASAQADRARPRRSPSPIFSSTLTPVTDHANTIDQQGVLPPGLYTLRIHAGSDDAAVSPDDSSAYYNMSLTLAPSSSTPRNRRPAAGRGMDRAVGTVRGCVGSDRPAQAARA